MTKSEFSFSAERSQIGDHQEESKSPKSKGQNNRFKPKNCCTVVLLTTQT